MSRCLLTYVGMMVAAAVGEKDEIKKKRKRISVFYETVGSVAHKFYMGVQVHFFGPPFCKN